jgi:hypothetical protein
MFIRLLAAALLVAASIHTAPAATWWKGNLHTHSLWSDGDDYPEMIAAWYREHGYHFLSVTDHNTLQAGERWIVPRPSPEGKAALEKYLARFGAGWVQRRERDGKSEVLLRPLDAYRGKFEAPGKFLLISGEEITARYKVWSIHLNAHNLAEPVPPGTGTNVLDIMQAGIDAVLEQRRRTGRAMFVHLNHPNFQWSITAEEIAAVKGERFFEVYNGHPMVHNEGDETRAGTERVWDIALAQRLASGGEILYGLATDDGHAYHEFNPKKSNPGRGWVMVRADALTPEKLIAALEAGDFYASSGVTLKDVRAEGAKHLTVEIAGEVGVDYTIRFIGTRRGYDGRSEPVKNSNGDVLRVTRRYSGDIGKVLQETKGTTARYTFQGDELYVRAHITSTQRKENPYVEGEFEQAWTQPVRAGK